MENISIAKKLQYYNSRLSNPSTSIVSWMVSRLSKYLDEADLDSFFHTISLMEVEKKEVVSKVLKEFKKESTVIV